MRLVIPNTIASADDADTCGFDGACFEGLLGRVPFVVAMDVVKV